MNIIDLTHVVSSDMPVYPGTEQPILLTGCSLEVDGFLEKKITLYSHTGTHVDAPAHLIKDGCTLNDLEISHFMGAACVLHLGNQKRDTIDLGALLSLEKEIESADFLLVNTGWSRYWGKSHYFLDYPVFSLEAADWLSHKHLKGVGFDTISADQADTRDYPIHNIFLGSNTIIIENLTNLGSLPQSGAQFSCLPIKFEDADGSPVRAVAYFQHSSTDL